MRFAVSLWLFLIPFSTILFNIYAITVTGKCLNDQKTLLLQFRSENTVAPVPSRFEIRRPAFHQTCELEPENDCCNWDGVGCDNDGHIIGLDLNSESITGGIDDSSSLFGLRYLQKLNLGGNSYDGTFPSKIFQVQTLKTIDLSNNGFLGGSLPEFPQNGALQNLVLSYTQFSGKLPDSISNLKKLSRIELGACNFNGPFPNSMSKLTKLTYLDFSLNGFTGSVPSLRLSKNLALLNLYQNSLTGEIPSSHWEGLDKLEFLSLGTNSLTGAISESLFSLPSLQLLDLSNNRFSGQIREIKNVASRKLATLDLSGNKFEGQIPEFLFKLEALASLTLSGNNFKDNIELSKFGTLKELRNLDLSRNKLSITTRSSPSSSLPQFVALQLASCNTKELPDLKNQSRLTTLDLSDNKIKGEIPNWIWEVGSGILRSLNLSLNQFSSLQEPYRLPSLLDVLILHSNQIQGSIPKLPPRAYYLDFSSNKFSSSVPSDIGNYLTSTIFFSIANNKITGVIPDSIGNARQIRFLNLAHNELEGPIPPSIGNLKELDTLDLSANKLSGNIPVQLANLKSLSSLNLSYNQLVGEIPQGSILQKFTEKAFEGNKGLCGAPLKKNCNAAGEEAHGPSILNGKKNAWYNDHVDLLLPEMLR